MAAAHLNHVHVCDNVFPSEGGKLNLIGIFAGIGNPGNIGFAQFPAVYPRLALAVGLSTTQKELPIEVTFRTEEGDDIVPPFNGTFNIDRPPLSKDEASSVNFNVNFDAFQIPKPGKLYLTVESNGEEISEIILNAVQSKPPTAPPAKT